MTAWWYKKDAFFYNNKYKENTNAQEELQDSRIIGIFFGMYLSRPDRLLAKHLAKFHDKVRATGGKFHIIFCSMDQNEKDCQDYVTQFHGNWLVIPWSHQSARRAAKNQCNNLGHPSLVIFRNDGEGILLSVDGKDEFEDYGGGAFGLWQEMATGSYVSEEAAVKKKSTKGMGGEVDDDDEEMMGPSYEVSLPNLEQAAAQWNATEKDINRGRGASLEFDAEARELEALEGRRSSAMDLTHDPDEEEEEGEENEGDQGPPQPAVVLAFPKRLSDADYELQDNGDLKKRSTELLGEPKSDLTKKSEGEDLAEDDSGGPRKLSQDETPTGDGPPKKSSSDLVVSKKSSKGSLDEEPRDQGRIGSQASLAQIKLSQDSPEESKQGSQEQMVGKDPPKRSSGGSIASKAPGAPSLSKRGSGGSISSKAPGPQGITKKGSESSIASKAPGPQGITKKGSETSIASKAPGPSLAKRGSEGSIVSKAPGPASLAKKGSEDQSVVGAPSVAPKKQSKDEPEGEEVSQKKNSDDEAEDSP